MSHPYVVKSYKLSLELTLGSLTKTPLNTDKNFCLQQQLEKFHFGVRFVYWNVIKNFIYCIGKKRESLNACEIGEIKVKPKSA